MRCSAGCWPAPASSTNSSATCSTGTKSASTASELAILRLGACELRHRPDVPARVVIDEYIELAKLFGAEASHKYVNGVLDKLAGSLRPTEMGREA